MKFIICLVILLLSSLTYASEEKFICSDIDSGGFNYDGNNYKITLFNLQTFEIIIDINNNKISVDLDMNEALERSGTNIVNKYKKGYMGKYSRLVSQSHLGCYC